MICFEDLCGLELYIFKSIFVKIILDECIVFISTIKRIVFDKIIGRNKRVETPIFKFQVRC